MNRLLFGFICLVYSIGVKADAAPKMDNRVFIEFYVDGKKTIEFDSIVILATHNMSSKSDTIYLRKERNNYFFNSLSKYDDCYILDLMIEIIDFEIKIFKESKLYSSGNLPYTGRRSHMKFELNKDGTMSDVSNLFYAKWSAYFTALFITILLELLLVILFRRKLNEYTFQFALILSAANLLTHPLLWYFHSNFYTFLLFLELAVIAVEFLILRITYVNNKSISPVILPIVVWANLISWIIGGIVFFIIYS